MTEPTEQEILQAIRDYHRGRGPTPDEFLTKHPQASVLSKMQKMADKGMLEYEGDIREARITGEFNE